jgi:hypothetical protein
MELLRMADIIEEQKAKIGRLIAALSPFAEAFRGDGTVKLCDLHRAHATIAIAHDMGVEELMSREYRDLVNSMNSAA